MVLDAASADVRAIHCEKPMAPTWGEAKAMHRAAAQKGVQLTFNHQRRFLEPFRLARRLLPGMYDRGWGRIVHVSSVHGHRASPYKSAYVSAKHGLEGLSKVIALEAAGKGVTSNTVCPGYVRTPLVEGQIAAQAASHGIPESDVVDDVLLARTPVKRLVEPEEVAGMVAYLCGPDAASITGSSFLLDGGWTAA
jgi:3-hydroxybutyrate dehydrogenase